MLRMIGEGLPVIIRQPWPAPDQTSQLGIGFTRIGLKMLRFLLRAGIVQVGVKPQLLGLFVGCVTGIRE